MIRSDSLPVATIFWKCSIFDHICSWVIWKLHFGAHLKVAFRMSFRNSNIDPFEVNACHITGLFSSRSCVCHSDNQFENLLLREEKEQPVGHFYRLWVTTLSQLNLSVDQTNTKNDVAIHRYSLNPRDRSGWKRRNIPSVQFQFLHHGSFRKPKYLDLKQFMLAIKKYVCEQGALIK